MKTKVNVQKAKRPAYAKKSKPAKRTDGPSRPEPVEFLWHLKHPFVDGFSHRHWWTEPNQPVEMEAVIWEILRRHPTVEGLIIQQQLDWGHDQKSNEWSPEEEFLRYNLDPYWQANRVEFLEMVRDWSYNNRAVSWDYDLILESDAMLSWAELPKESRKLWCEWVRQLRPQHGFKTDEDGLVSLITDEAQLTKQLKKYTHKRLSSESRRTKPHEAWTKLWSSRYAEMAKSSFCGGQVLLSFNPLLPNAEKLVALKVSKLMVKLRKAAPKAFAIKFKSPSSGRARVNDWLAVIQVFEKAEMSEQKRLKRDDQLFARYRRIIKSWKF